MAHFSENQDFRNVYYLAGNREDSVIHAICRRLESGLFLWKDSSLRVLSIPDANIQHESQKIVIERLGKERVELYLLTSEASNRAIHTISISKRDETLRLWYLAHEANPQDPELFT
ncbi:MAG: hypothetical protein H7A36_06405 [Chlamydiales bacterium]|nr:hypothetical protein [Chlamydiales bacterium]